MDLHALGEFGLIDLIRMPHAVPETVIVGIGDDCAVLPYNENLYQLASCDLLVEDIHFLRDQITAYQLGYKAVAVNLSDIAAMGGTPAHILLSVAVPPYYTVAEWQDLYRGIGEICNRYNVNLIGGDTTSSTDKLTVNVTVLGFVEKENLHLRSDAKPGDAVFVTGVLGGSRAGLELVLCQDIPAGETCKNELLRCHYQPEPCCHEIAALNKIAGSHLHALNDISDGLVSECYEIADVSHCAIQLYTDSIPVHCEAAHLAGLIHADAMQWALFGGEDYQLVGTMDGAYAEEICSAYTAQTGKQITIVGYVSDGDGVYLRNGKAQKNHDDLPDEAYRIAKKGYNHFASASESHTASNEVVDLLLSQVTQLSRQIEAQTVYRHDLKNHLSCILGFLESGAEQDAEVYLRQLLDAAPKRPFHQYTGRTAMNILCNQKALLAEERAIEFQVNLPIEQDLLAQISDYDLCTLIGNLLDNGMEHAGGAEPYLYLDLFLDNAGNTVLRMENSCITPPVLHDGFFASCKADSSSHGKGMGQIQCITEKYHGIFSWQFDAQEERFITLCVFEANQNC